MICPWPIGWGTTISQASLGKRQFFSFWGVLIKTFWRIQVLFVVPLIPLFWTSGMSVIGFKARVDFSLALFLTCMLFLTFTSGVTPAYCMVASMAPMLFGPTHLQPPDISTSIGGTRTYLRKDPNPRPTMLQRIILNHWKRQPIKNHHETTEGMPIHEEAPNRDIFFPWNNSANVARIILVKCDIGSVVEIFFFGKWY